MLPHLFEKTRRFRLVFSFISVLHGVSLATQEVISKERIEELNKVRLSLQKGSSCSSHDPSRGYRQHIQTAPLIRSEPDAFLDMQIVPGHVHVGVPNDTLCLLCGVGSVENKRVDRIRKCPAAFGLL